MVISGGLGPEGDRGGLRGEGQEKKGGIGANFWEGPGRRSARHEQSEQAQRAIEHEKKSEKNGPPPRRPAGDNK